MKTTRAVASNVFIHNALDRAARQDGCMVCVALRREEERLVESFLYEGVMAPAVRQEFVERGGFCPRHFRLALRRTREAHLGQSALAILCSQLVPHAGASIERAEQARRSSLRSRLARGSEPSGHTDCIFCEDGQHIEADLVAGLETLLGDESLMEKLEQDSLCYRHCRSAVVHWKQAAHRQWLRERVRKQTEGLTQELKELLKKYTHEHGHERMGKEADVVDRSMAFLVGSEE